LLVDDLPFLASRHPSRCLDRPEQLITFQLRSCGLIDRDEFGLL